MSTMDHAAGQVSPENRDEHPFHKEVYQPEPPIQKRNEQALLPEQLLQNDKQPGVDGVTKYLKTVAEQFSKIGDRLLATLKPHECAKLSDEIERQGCPVAKLRKALAAMKPGASKSKSGEQAS